MFLRVLKHQNKSGCAYKLSVARGVRTGAKVRHEILLYIGTFQDRHRPSLPHLQKFYARINDILLESDFKAGEKTNIKDWICEVIPELRQIRNPARQGSRR